MKGRAPFLAGVALVFVSGMFYSALVPLFLVEFAGASVESGAVGARDTEGEPASCADNPDSIHPECVPRPPEQFYLVVLLYAMGGAPFAAAGSYLIKKYRKY